ncbi:MAG: hypothetical protein ACYSUI_22510, partial [Planctomycetota bacterium]
MANETIIATQDTYLSEGNSTAVRASIPFLNLNPSGGGGAENPIFQFDISDLAGKTWDSVVLKLTWDANGGSYSSQTIFLSYVKETEMVIDDCSWDNKVQSLGTAW